MRLRKRPDLVVTRQRYGHAMCWVVKDPLGLKFFRLEDEEKALLDMLDGQSSLEQIKERFESRFAPQKLRLEDVQRFLTTLHEQGLIVSDLPGQAEQLLARRSKRTRQQWLQKLASPLAIRWRGFHPQRLLDFLYPALKWMYTWPALAIGWLVMLSALALVAVEFEEFRQRLPAFHQFFTPANLPWLMLSLATIKVLHELGHGLTCRHYGGRCHEMGVMLLVFTPCLYMNVSDAWRLPGKWRRMAVSAAGMYVELLIAAVATFVWWFSQPGLINQIALSTMFVGSVGTLLFNGNPLLRYDGYYILSDLVETPNLAAKANQVVLQFAGRWLLGQPASDEPPPRGRGWLALYAVAATVYRWFITFSILWFVYQFLRPHRLEIGAQVLLSLVVFSLVVRPLWQLYRFFAVPGRSQQVKRWHVACSSAAAAVLIGLTLFLPLPNRVWGTLELEPRDAHRVYVDVPGQLTELAVRPGQRVAAGEVLATLTNLDLDLAVAQLEGQRQHYEVQLANLRRERFQNQAAALQAPELQQSLAAVDEQLREKRSQRGRLQLRAPVDGVVLPPAEAPPPAAEGELPHWSGSPLKPCNLGCTLAESTLVCQVGDAARWQALVVVDQSDLPYLSLGQRVDIKLDELPDITLHGTIAEISACELKSSPRHLSNKVGGDLATRTDDSGHERPIITSYQLLVPLDPPLDLAQHSPTPFRIGLRGSARIHAPHQPLATTLLHWLNRTFHFRL